MLTPREILSRFNFAIEQNLAGKMPASETEQVTRHLYGCIREASDAIKKEDYDKKRDAELVRFEMHQDLQYFGIEVEY